MINNECLNGWWDFLPVETTTEIPAQVPVADETTYFTNGSGAYPVADIIAVERFLPNSHAGHVKWREIEGKKYYMPGEVCDPIGREWFFTEDDQPRSDEELLGMYLVSISRGTNLLLDVGPDKHGLIPQKYVGALQRLRKNLDRLGVV